MTTMATKMTVTASKKAAEEMTSSSTRCADKKISQRSCDGEDTKMCKQEKEEEEEEEEEEGKEETWIEAEGNRDDSSDEYDVDNEEPDIGDLFADPDPTDTFTLTFPHVKNNNNNNNDTYHDTAAAENRQDKGDKHGSSNKQAAAAEFETITITLNGIKAENGQTLKSTGLTLWRASNLLCSYLSCYPDIVRGKTVLELGAGLGLCGILASKLGAKHVIMTDGDTDVLAEMRKNVQANNMPNDYKKEQVAPLISCRQLRWGKNLEKFKKKWCCSSHDIDEDGFDVIMGSDIIYVEDILEPLFDTVIQLLSTSRTSKFLLSYARRNVGIDLVLECAKRFGLQWMEPDEVEGVFEFTRTNSAEA